MALVDMARTAADKKAEQERWQDSPAQQEDYPYGLSISLDDASLEKLKLGDADLDPGDPVMLSAKCSVREYSVRTVNGKTMRSLCLQLEQIELTQVAEPGETVEETLYGK